MTACARHSLQLRLGWVRICLSFCWWHSLSSAYTCPPSCRRPPRHNSLLTVWPNLLLTGRSSKGLCQLQVHIALNQISSSPSGTACRCRFTQHSALQEYRLFLVSNRSLYPDMRLLALRSKQIPRPTPFIISSDLSGTSMFTDKNQTQPQICPSLHLDCSQDNSCELLHQYQEIRSTSNEVWIWSIFPMLWHDRPTLNQSLRGHPLLLPSFWS